MEIRGLLRRPAVVAAMTLFLVVVSSVLCSMFYAAPAQADDDDDGEFVNGEIVVKLKDGTDPTLFNLDYGTTTKDTFLGSANIHLLQVTDGGDAEAKADAMESDTGRVLYAEPNLTTDAPEGGGRHKFRSDADPVPSSDPAPYSGQYAVGALNLECTRGINKGANTTVAVLDTGAQPDHPELSGSLTPGYDFIGDDANPAEEPNGLDDDGDTFVDEGTGHGTHVAGIVHLVAPEAKIMPLRVLDSDGAGNVFVIAEAVQYAVKNDADVINMSLGSSQDSELLEDVIEDLEADDEADDDADDDDGPVLEGVPLKGVVMAASAGNENVETPQYPAAEDGVLAVTSVNQQEKKSEWANYGSWTSIAAPGEDVYSAFPTDRYASWDGTSMAAPFVAGQAALMRSVDSSLDATAVGNTIKGTARSLDAANPSYAGKLGAGHADVGASMEKLRPGAGCGEPVNAKPVNTKPMSSDASPSAGSATRDRTPTVKARMRDAQTELRKSDITLYVSGNQIERTRFSYNVATDGLSYTSNRLTCAKHQVTIRARDGQGLVGSKTWSFKVRPRR